jgi:arylsulfatase B
MLRSLLPALLAALLAAPAAAQVRHVVVVVLDDVGVDKVGCYGPHPSAGFTPAIDALAASGLRFTQAYANPRCSPSRAAMLTGRYGSHTGIGCPLPTYEPRTDPNGPFLPRPEEPWLPRLLPLRSDLVGKWNLNHVDQPSYHTDPLAKGFLRWRGHLVNPEEPQGEGLYHWQKQSADPSGWTETTSSDFITSDNAHEAWLALRASAGRRSLLWLALQAAHPPWDELPPAELFTPVDGLQTDVQKEQYSLQAGDTLLGQLRSFYAEQLPADAALTTWIVIGDNGTPEEAIAPPWPSEHGKGTLYQGGVHVPLIVSGYGVAAPGSTTDALVAPVDVWATVLELFGVAPPLRPRTDSVSFAPVIAGGAGARSAVYVRQHRPNGFGPYTQLEEAATDGHWKLIQRLSGGHELYDLDADPKEQSDLWPPDAGAEAEAAAALQAVIDASG